MPWTPKTFVKRAPAFKCVSPLAIQQGIDEAERSTNRENWGVKADDAVFYLAAHLITLNTHLNSLDATGGLSAPAGPVKSESLLEWSATYETSAALSGEAMATTSWGRIFVAMRRTIFSRRCL